MERVNTESVRVLREKRMVRVEDAIISYTQLQATVSTVNSKPVVTFYFEHHRYLAMTSHWINSEWKLHVCTRAP